jgi:gliding motility-associated lipoprotein GldD
MKSYASFIIYLSILLFSSCYEDTYLPKPRGFYKIGLPEKEYQPFLKTDYPYSFEYPVYASISKDTLFFDQKTENPWWINLNFDSLGGKVYISYKQISSTQTLEKLLEDSYKLSHYHTKKADYINEPEFHTANNVHGVFYDVGGNAASSFQFYATDSFHHFLRGALYFDVTPNVDSLKPVNQFLQKDIEHLIQTLKWN